MNPNSTDKDSRKPANQPESDEQRLMRAQASLTRKLIKHEPQIAAGILDSLPLPERARLVARYHGADRLNLILLSADSRGLVQSLPAPEFWITVKEIGEEEAHDLVRMAHPSQLQHVLDLEWWHHDKLDPLAVAYWLMIFGEAGPEAVIGWFRQADEELLVTALSRFFHVFKPDPDNEGAEPWRAFKYIWTLDGVYHLHFLDPLLAPTIERFLRVVRDEEPMKYMALLDAVEFSVLPEQEQQALRLRMARLEDFGFVEADEAIEIYAPISDAELSRIEKEAAADAGARSGPRAPDAAAADYPLSLLELPPLLGRALAEVSSDEVIEDARLGLGALASRILIADAMDMSKLESVRAALEKAHAFVEMGLRRWAQNDVRRAARILETRNLFVIFRAGFTSVIEAGRRASRLVREQKFSGTRQGLELLGDDGILIKGLQKSRPKFYAGADEQGSPVFRDFRTEAEVERAVTALDRAHAVELLFLDAMGVDAEGLQRLKEHCLAPALVWETVFLTAVGQALAGNDFKASPLSKQDARAAISAMFAEGAPRAMRDDVRDQLRERVREAVSRLADASARDLDLCLEFVDAGLARLEEEVRDLDLENLDPRYLKSLVILP